MGYTANYASEEPARTELDGWSGTVLLEFGTAWCGHCQALQPELQAIMAEHPEVRHVKIEDGKGKPLGRAFKVKLWPNLVLLKDGRVLEQLARPRPDEVRAMLAAAG